VNDDDIVLSKPRGGGDRMRAIESSVEEATGIEVAGTKNRLEFTAETLEEGEAEGAAEAEEPAVFLCGGRPTYADIFVLVTVILAEQLGGGRIIIDRQRHRCVCKWMQELMSDCRVSKIIDEMTLLNRRPEGSSIAGGDSTVDHYVASFPAASTSTSISLSPAVKGAAAKANNSSVVAPVYAHYSLVHGVVYPPFISELAVDSLRRHFQSRPGDVFVCSYPTSGVTWMQQLLVLLLHWQDPDHGKSCANPSVLQCQAPWLEGSFCAPRNQSDTSRSYLDWSILDGDGSQAIDHPLGSKSISAPGGDVEQMERKADVGGQQQQPPNQEAPTERHCAPQATRRIFKSHAPYQLFPCSEENLHPESKIIYLARNPKNVACSAYTRAKSSPDFGYDGEWEEFFERMYMPGLCESGSWFEHNVSWYKAFKDSPAGRNGQILNVYYEDLQRDLYHQLERIAAFLDIPTSPTMLEKVMELSSLADMIQKKPVISPLQSTILTSSSSSSSSASPLDVKRVAKRRPSMNSTSKLMERLGSVIEKSTWHVDNGGRVTEAQSRMIDKVFREYMPTELYKINLQHGISRSGDMMFKSSTDDDA
jgi:hypothetical protein